MASSFHRMEHMRDSIAEIVKIFRMVFKFHLLLTVANVVFQIMLLLDWVVEEISNLWEDLKVYWQKAAENFCSQMRALRDRIAEEMKNLSKALKIHLIKEAQKDQPKAKKIAKLALFLTVFLLMDSEFPSDCDGTTSMITGRLLLPICLLLLKDWKRWSQLGILHGRWSCTVNSISNFLWFYLALYFEKFYDKSWMSLGAALCLAVFFLSLLVLFRPRTDLGFFGFIMGVIGSVTYDLYGFKSPTLIIASICFILFCFKSWLDKYWLDLEEDQTFTSTNTIGGTGMLLAFPTSSTAAHGIIVSVGSEHRVADHGTWLVFLVENKEWLVMAIFWVVWVRIRNFCPEDHHFFLQEQLPTGVKYKTQQVLELTGFFIYLDTLIFDPVVKNNPPEE